MFLLVLTVKSSQTTVLLRFSHRGGSEKHFGTMCTKQDHAVAGVLDDRRSVYEGLSQLSDMRKARKEEVVKVGNSGDDYCDGEIAWEWLEDISPLISPRLFH